MALTKLHAKDDIAGQDFRRLGKRNANDILADKISSGLDTYYDPAASVETDGSGDIDIDLSATLATIDVTPVLTVRENSNYNLVWDSGAAAGHLKFRVIQADTGAAVTVTTVAFGYIVTGTAV